MCFGSYIDVLNVSKRFSVLSLYYLVILFENMYFQILETFILLSLVQIRAGIIEETKLVCDILRKSSFG